MIVPLRVLMLGPALDVQGGITSIERVILATPGGIQFRHVGTFSGESRLWRPVSYILSWPAFLRGLVWCDVVHVHFSQWGSTFRKLPMCAACVLFGKPFILHANGSRYHRFFARLPGLAKWIIRRVFGQCAAFIAVSRQWADFYREKLRLPPDVVKVLHNPVMLPTNVPDKHDGSEVRFVAFGRIGERKGQFDLIRAVAGLPAESRSRCHVLIAGDGEVNSAIGIAGGWGLGDRVEVRGWIGSVERDAAMAAADAFVLVSHDEGLPMALLEAMAWGLPVVTTPVGGIPEVVRDGENGLLVRPGDVAAISSAMQRLIEDAALRLRLGKQARVSVEPLRVERFMEGLQRIYEESVAAIANRSSAA